MLWINPFIIFISSRAHSSFNALINSDFFIGYGLLFLTLLHRICHRFSSGFRSGEFAGQIPSPQLSKLSFSYCLQRTNAAPLWYDILSSITTTSPNSSMLVSQKSNKSLSRICSQYSSAFNFPSPSFSGNTTSSLSFPYHIAPHTLIFLNPLMCVTPQQSSSYSSSGYLHTQTWPTFAPVCIAISSVNITRIQSSTVQWINFLANLRRAHFCWYIKNDRLCSIRWFMPVLLIACRIVLDETCKFNLSLISASGSRRLVRSLLTYCFICLWSRSSSLGGLPLRGAEMLRGLLAWRFQIFRTVSADESNSCPIAANDMPTLCIAIITLRIPGLNSWRGGVAFIWRNLNRRSCRWFRLWSTCIEIRTDFLWSSAIGETFVYS